MPETTFPYLYRNFNSDRNFHSNTYVYSTKDIIFTNYNTWKFSTVSRMLVQTGCTQSN